YAQRGEWTVDVLSWDEIRTALRRRPSAPWLLVDAADATTGGAEGSSAEAIRELWPLRDELPGEVLLWVVDPAARARAARGETHVSIGREEFPIEGQVLFA